MKGNRCIDAAILAHKETQFDCRQPDCPGFDPAGEFGPCFNCASVKGCLCCPDPESEDGYSYCPGDAGFCCKPGGGCISCSG